MQGKKKNEYSADLISSPRKFFNEMVSDALESRKLETFPMAKNYLIDLLEFFVVSENLFMNRAEEGEPKTLAEMYLKAANAESSIKIGLLKKLGDMSLYVSGFFGDSLKRKVVDIQTTYFMRVSLDCFYSFK